MTIHHSRYVLDCDTKDGDSFSNALVVVNCEKCLKRAKEDNLENIDTIPCEMPRIEIRREPFSWF